MPVLTKSGPSPRSMKAIQQEPERLWRKELVKQMSCKSGVKGDCDQVMHARWKNENVMRDWRDFFLHDTI